MRFLGAFVNALPYFNAFSGAGAGRMAYDQRPNITISTISIWGTALSRKLLKSTAITGGMTTISRITGLIRDVVFANILGAGVMADAFFVAFRIPNFFRRIFGEGAFSQAFVPVCAEYKNNRSHDEVRAFLGHMGARFALILFIFTVLGTLASPWIIYVLAPGFVNDPDKFQITVQSLYITFPYLFFISLVAMAAGVMNTYGRFSVPAFTPVLLNLSLIGAAILLVPYVDSPALALSWGVFIAGVAQLLFQLPLLAKLGLLPRPSLAPHEGVTRVFKRMLPAILGSSASQINMLVNTFLASLLVTGSISWLQYSDRLMEFPLGIFGIAIATVILPSLSKKYVSNSHDEFSHILDWALRWVFLIGLPATVGLMVLAGPMLTTLFNYGKFSAHDVEMSAQALVAFSVGLPALILVKVLAPGFYARQNTKTPAKIALIAFGSNIVLAVVLVQFLQHVGLALAISIAAYINAGLLFFLLYKRKFYVAGEGWLLYFLQLVVATAAMGAVVYWGAGEPDTWLNAGKWLRIGRLLLWVSVGAGVYGLMLLILGVRPKSLVMKQKP